MSSFLYQNIINFRPPRLIHNSLGWNIEYYILDPLTNKLIRKRFRLNQLRQDSCSADEFKQKANAVLQELTIKLVSGWHPDGELQSGRYYTDLFSALDKFIEAKSRELRPDSMRTYKGIVKIFKEYKRDSCMCIDFRREQALQFMDHCTNHRKVSVNTWNTYLKLCRVIWGWLKDNLYIKDNPFSSIKKKRADEKYRTIIPIEDRVRIAEYFRNNNIGYLLVCDLVFYSLIRPTELTRLRVRDVDIVDGTIFLPNSVTKCHRHRFTPIDPAVKDCLRDFIAGHQGSDYLFGRLFKPGCVGLKKKMYLVMWERMRDDLKLPDCYQLYSLRDSGIKAKLDAGMPPEVVMSAAGHHDLGETTKYVIKADKEQISTIVRLSPSLL